MNKETVNPPKPEPEASGAASGGEPGPILSALSRRSTTPERTLVLASAAMLFAAVFALSLAVDKPAEAVSVLYVLPVALLAVELGVVPGLAAAALALGLFAVRTIAGDVDVGLLGFVTRGVAFFLLGGLLGYMSLRLRQAHEAVRGRERQLQAILDNTSAVIYLKDRKGRYMLVNRKFEELFHVTREGLRGKTDHDLFPAYAADAFRANDRRVLKEGRALEIEEIAPHDDGPHTYISVKFPLLDERGKTYAVCGISTDITDRKEAERELRESKDRVREIIDSAQEAFVSIDQQGVITSWNRAAEETFGWPASKIVGRSLAETIIPPRFREAHARGLERFLSTGEGPLLRKRVELTGLHEDGHELPIEITISSVKVRGGFAFHAFLHDISERKRVELETRISQDAAAPAGRERTGPGAAPRTQAR